MLYCMMLLYNVYVCLLKFLRKFVNVWGVFCFCFFVFFLIICAILLYFTLFSVMSFLLEFILNVQLG